MIRPMFIFYSSESYEAVSKAGQMLQRGTRAPFCVMASLVDVTHLHPKLVWVFGSMIHSGKKVPEDRQRKQLKRVSSKTQQLLRIFFVYLLFPKWKNKFLFCLCQFLDVPGRAAL